MPWDEVIPKFRAGKLKSSSGQKVTNPKQAVAIEYSEKGEAKDNPEYRPKKFAHARRP
jgi:hypothetical protein